MTARDRLQLARAELQRVLEMAEDEGRQWAENVADALELVDAADAEADLEDAQEHPHPDANNSGHLRTTAGRT